MQLKIELVLLKLSPTEPHLPIRRVQLLGTKYNRKKTQYPALFVVERWASIKRMKNVFIALVNKVVSVLASLEYGLV